jgi:hypothetical protein
MGAVRLVAVSDSLLGLCCRTHLQNGGGPFPINDAQCGSLLAIECQRQILPRLDATTSCTKGLELTRTVRPGAVSAFREQLRGRLVGLEDAGYDAARKVWNGRIDRRPPLIAFCAGTNDVIAAVRFAREQELVTAVRAGGHGVPGTAVCDDGRRIARESVVGRARVVGVKDPDGNNLYLLQRL